MEKEGKPFDFGKLFGWIPQGFKFGPGVIGKNANIVLGSMIPLCLVAVCLRNEPWAALALGVLVMAYILYNQHRMVKYAEENPAPALLEGAHLVSALKLGKAKGTPDSTDNRPIPSPDAIPITSSTVIEPTKPDPAEPPAEVKP